MTALICYCTCPDAADASRLAETLVTERLAACVNVVAGVQSVYRWQGRIERADEVLLLIKTTAVRLDALQRRILALHPYDMPEVIAVGVQGGSPAYLDWIHAQCSEGT